MLQFVERALDRLVGQSANPLRQLGALGFWLFWIVVASGAYVYAFFDTSVSGAHASIQGWRPWHPAGMMRSIHRYASDALVVIVLLHALRELAYGRYRAFRWFSWITGLPLLALALASGIIGYWLVWDQGAQFIGIALAEWLGSLPGLGDALVRNFIAPEAVSDRFFSLLAFAHIGVCLFLLLGMWLHLQRIALPRCHPGPNARWSMLAMLIALALVRPALSQAPAELSHVPVALAFDWLFLAPFPLVYRFSPAIAWSLVAATGLLLCALPWSGPRRAVHAVVDAGRCNGCGRCVADCPYGAVLLVPNGARKQAKLLPQLCAGCGICTGACPASLPLHGAVRTAIDLPRAPLAALWQRLERSLAQRGSLLVFGCDHGACVSQVSGASVSAFSLPCIGMLPPSFIEHALRRGAAGVLLAGCAAGCEFRLGSRWTEARLQGGREPRLRSRFQDRVRFVEAAPGDELALQRAVDALPIGAPPQGPAASHTEREAVHA